MIKDIQKIVKSRKLMCGRYSLTVTKEQIAEAFSLSIIPEHQPRHNIAPSQSVLAILEGETGWQAQSLRWGLIPSWAKDDKLYQIRFSKPSFSFFAQTLVL